MFCFPIDIPCLQDKKVGLDRLWILKEISDKYELEYNLILFGFPMNFEISDNVTSSYVFLTLIVLYRHVLMWSPVCKDILIILL